MHGKAAARGEFLPQDQVELVILGFNETGFAVIPTLNHMIGELGKVHPCIARHGKTFRMGDGGRISGQKDCLKFNPSVPNGTYLVVPEKVILRDKARELMVKVPI